jgi:hypothetical protein
MLLQEIMNGILIWLSQFMYREDSIICLYGFGPSYTQQSLVLLNKFSLIIPCHILLFYMFQAQWLIIRNKLSLELPLASQYHYSILYIYIYIKRRMYQQSRLYLVLID